MWQIFDFLYNLFVNLFFRKDKTVAELTRELDRVLELAEIEVQQYENANYIEQTEDDLDEVTDEKCILSQAKITSLNNEVGMLNREILFPLSKAQNLNLSEGQTVSYLWYKNDEAIKICRIVEIVEENWNQPVTDEAIEEVRQKRPEVFSTCLISKVGFICQKQKDRIVVQGEDDKFEFSLDDVESTFLPRKYDQISFVCKVQRDAKIVNEAGITIDVQKIEPNIIKRFLGKITEVQPNEYGTIDGKCFFWWDALVADYRTVTIGDQVTAECIQCEKVDETVYEWRCLKVVLIESATSIDQDISPYPSKSMEAENKHGIEITDNIVVEFNEIEKYEKFKMRVKNNSPDVQEVLESVFIGNRYDSQLRLISPGRNDSFFLKPGEERQFKFEAKSKFFGDAQERFYIKFSGPAGRFKIFRNITISVHDTEQLHPFIGTGANIRKNLSYTRKVYREDNSAMIPGTPIRKSANFVKTKFQQWQVPASLMKIVSDPKCNTNYVSETLDSVMPFLKENLNIKTYSIVFHYLLYLEEAEMFHNMRRYDKKGFFKREGEYLSLAVQNIAESRPSLVIGDHVIASSLFASQKEQGKADKFQGFIHEVKSDRILLKFNDGFHSQYNSEDYDIVFHFSRTPLRKQHHAVELVIKKLPSLLFPNKISTIEKQIDVNLNVENGELLECDDSTDIATPWYNPSLNIVQKQAVTNILQGVARPLPYIIFGPPGTGKTVTLIETILQLYKKVPHSRILVATPSNSSANLITERLIESGVLMQGEFLRLVSENSIRKETLPENIISHCATIDIAREGTTKDDVVVTASGLKMNCNARFLKLRRVLIGTCVTLGTLMQCDFPPDHFTHVIIDESGQCLETEIMIPVSFVEKRTGQIILAGDPMQLGPIVLSRYAKARGLDQSYLVRLLDRSPYKPDPERFENRYDPRLVTRLVYNYRSLPSILNVYSELFYDKDLKAMVNDVDSAEANIVKQLRSILPNEEHRHPTHGLIFVGVEGKSQKCADSPSWLNKAEANNVLQFFMKLIRIGFSADDIGIITPYTQQAKTIRMIIETTDLIMPKVGTIEEFQGQERKIILLSTVRTMGREIKISDKKYSLGFVKSPKRMNVAISRARALLVIFGSPQLLIQDLNWKFLIENCVKNHSAVNCNITTVTDEYDSDEADADV